MHLLSVFRLIARINARLYTVAVQNAFGEFHRSSVIVPPFRTSGVKNISIGRNVTIGSNSWLQAINPPDCRSIVLSIGEFSSFAGYCTITACKSVIIERKVLIARYCYISDHSHSFAAGGGPVIDQPIGNVSPVRIGEGSWLGQSVVVCPGVTIGRNAVIGANSVVRQDVPDYCVAAGAPAKIIRRIGQ